MREEHEIIRKFPDLFADNATVNIPIGWTNEVERALSIVADSGLKPNICVLETSDRRPKAWSEEGWKTKKETNGILNFVNELLSSAESLCIICGRYKETQTQSYGNRRDRKIPPLCPACLKNYGYVRLQPKTQPEDDENEWETKLMGGHSH